MIVGVVNEQLEATINLIAVGDPPPLELAQEVL